MQEADDLICDILKASEQFNESRDEHTALVLEQKLTMLKLVVGIGAFQELNSFARLERDVSGYLNRLESERNIKEAIEADERDIGDGIDRIGLHVDRIGEALGIKEAKAI